MNVYRTPADPGGFPFGYNWRATLTGLAFLVLFNFGATQYVAFRFHYQIALGPPLLRTRQAAVYDHSPGASGASAIQPPVIRVSESRCLKGK